MSPGVQLSIFCPKIESSVFDHNIDPKMGHRGLLSIFGQELRNSTFQPKINPGGQKSNFD